MENAGATTLASNLDQYDDQQIVEEAEDERNSYDESQEKTD